MVKPINNFGMIFIIAVILTFPISNAFPAANLEEGIIELSEKISKNMTDNQRRKIAIIEFSDLSGNVTEFGQFLAEELITQLFQESPGQFEVVERRQIMKVLAEQKLTMSGLLDAKAMESVGKILGIEAIVTGSITDLGSNVKINARLIGVDTAKVFAVAATKIPKVDIVKDLMDKRATPVQVPSAGTSPTGYVSSTKTSKPTGVFQNKFVRASVINISTVPERKKLTISIRIENVTDQDLKLHLFGGYMYAYAQAISNKGEVCKPKRNNVTGVFVGNQTERMLERVTKTQVTSISPGSSALLGIRMECDEGPEGDVYDFSAEFAAFLKNEQEVFSVSLPGVTSVK